MTRPAMCLAAAAALLAVLVAWSRERPAAAHRIARWGISIRLPPGWHGRFIQEASGPFAPPPPRRLVLTRARDVRVVLSEAGDAPGSQGFRPATRPISLSPADVVGSRATRRFALHGRSFVVAADFAARSVDARRLRALDVVLATLRVRWVVPPATWRALRRPLDLRLPHRSSCPRTHSGRRAPNTAFGLGRGPAYAVLGSGRTGVVRLADVVRRYGWYGQKTLWTVGPRYSGPLLIRGRRLDGGGPVRFGSPHHPDTELHILPADGWRYEPSTTLLRRPGCYALRVDGRGLRQTIVVVAR